MVERRTYSRRMYDTDYAKRDMVERESRKEANKFLKANEVLTRLRKYHSSLTAEEYYDIRSMALEGNVDTAKKKLGIILIDRLGWGNYK